MDGPATNKRQPCCLIPMSSLLSLLFSSAAALRRSLDFFRFFKQNCKKPSISGCQVRPGHERFLLERTYIFRDEGECATDRVVPLPSSSPVRPTMEAVSRLKLCRALPLPQ